MQTDPSTVLKVSAICGASYGAQMGLAADTFEPVYYKSGSGRSASWEWFGHAISGGSLIQAAAASKPSKRPCDAARPKPGQPRPPQNGQGRPAPGAHPAPANWAQVLGYAARLSSVLVKTASM